MAGGSPCEAEKTTNSVSGRRFGDLYKPPGNLFADIARSSRFEQLTNLVIGFNSVWIAVDVELNQSETLNEATLGFQVAENSFCSFYTTEWLVRFAAYQRKRDCLRDMWFLFDSGLVAVMVFETWIMYLVVELAGGAGGMDLNTLTILRLLRLLRLTRITRLMRAIPELMFMIQGLISAMRSVFITLFLVLIVVYVFAVALVQLLKNDDVEVGKNNFDGVWHAMCTLTVQAILPDQAPLLEELSTAGWYYSAAFFVFLVLATLTITNMLIGILCEVACRVSAREKELMDIELVQNKMASIVQESLDRDQDNNISKAEFQDIVKNDRACKALRQVGVEASDLLEHADFVFDDWDDDGEYVERTLGFDEFMEIVMKLRGTNVATIRDVTNLRKYVKDALLGLERSLLGEKKSLRRSGGSDVLGRNMSPTNSRRASAISMCSGRNLAEREESTHELSGRMDASPLSQGSPVSSLRYDMTELRGRITRLEGLVEKVLEGQKAIEDVVRLQFSIKTSM